jgi:uncharacterized protein (TIGR02145 family)
MNKKWYLFILSFILISYLQAQEVKHDPAGKKFTHVMGTFTDPRDGTTYTTITFRRQHHGAVIERTWYAENVKFKVEGSICYNNTKEFCDKFGRLYNYRQANLACPEGWHVPTIHEWKHLFHFFGGWHHSGQYLIEGEESDMDMLFGGFGTPGGAFNGVGVHGNWWDNELKDSNSAGIITLKKGTDQIFHSKVGDSHYLSCRCVLFHN